MRKDGKTRRPARAKAEAAAGLALDRAPVGTIDLVFTHHDRLEHVKKAIWHDVSCLAVAERSIFCSCDETATVERVLHDREAGKAASHVNFALGLLFDLPEGPAGEMDIEGLAVADGYLWICGSHSLKRKKPKDNGLADMEEIAWDANRGFLGRVPVSDRGGGVFELVVSTDATDAAPERRARMVAMGDSRGTPIRKMLRRDPVIGPFIDVPSKENGLDIEGLAVRGDTVLLGLRGPVIRGLAVLVRMQLRETEDGLKPRRLKGGARYSLQAIDLNGQGVRDLAWQGDRLLILSGATTDLEALQSVFAIENYDPDCPIYPAGEVRRVLDLPIRRGSDNAEGIAVLDIDGEDRLLVAYDSPHHERTDDDEGHLTVDVFALAPPHPRKARRRQAAASASSKAASVAS